MLNGLDLDAWFRDSFFLAFLDPAIRIVYFHSRRSSPKITCPISLVIRAGFGISPSPRLGSVNGLKCCPAGQVRRLDDAAGKTIPVKHEREGGLPYTRPGIRPVLGVPKLNKKVLLEENALHLFCVVQSLDN